MALTSLQGSLELDALIRAEMAIHTPALILPRMWATLSRAGVSERQLPEAGTIPEVSSQDAEAHLVFGIFYWGNT